MVVSLREMEALSIISGKSVYRLSLIDRNINKF